VAEWFARIASRRSTSTQRLGGIGHGDPQVGVARAGRPGDRPGIADLAAALAIERGLVGEDHHVVARTGGFDFLAVLDQRDHPALAAGRGVAGELARALAFGDVEPDLAVGGLARALPRGARGGLLPCHRRIEARLVHRDPARAQRVLGQVIGKAVGVVELERGFAGQLRALAQIGRFLVQQLEAVRQGAAELHFLALKRFLDQRLRAAEFGIGLTHLGDERGHQPVHQRLLRAQEVRMAHGAAHDAAQNIAAPLVRRQHAIGEQEAGRTQVIGNDAVARLRVALGGHARQPDTRGDERLEQVDVVVVVHALHDRGDAFEAHAGVDGGARQIADDLAGSLLELHEHEVPDLDEPVAVLFRRSRRPAPDMVAVIVEHFRARAARAIVAHRPEVVLGRDADDPAVGQARDLLPQIEGLVVGVIDGDQQLFDRKRPLLRQQGPGMRDRLLLEIIAEREISEHFEEGMVTRGVTHVVEIVVLAAGAHALLR